MIADDWTTMAVRLGLATVLGLGLGFEREWNGHDAGIRTHALVALSSSMIMVSALLIHDDLLAVGTQSDPVRAIQGLAQAIGFIAGGLIFVRGGDVRNMTTAASLWMAAAIGIGAGAGQISLVVTGAVITFAVLILLNLLKRFIPEKQKSALDRDTSMPNRRGGTADHTPESENGCD